MVNKNKFFAKTAFFLLLAIGTIASASAQNLKFSSTDLGGKKVTDEIFKKADVTVVNVWGTFCGPCIREMPELASWHASMPKNVQIIGIVCDVNSERDAGEIEYAKMICEKTGVKFTNIISNESFSAFMNDIQFVPTTILVDKNGKTVGEMIVGANVKKYKKAVDDYLSGR